MKTKERVKVTSLELFNIYGEPNVTTVDIANEMDISPGNLYYHYRNKDEIISVLMSDFESLILEALMQVEAYLLSVDELWQVTREVFERIWRYRFLFRDLNNLIGKQQKFSRRMQRLIKQQASTIDTVLSAMKEGDMLRASDDELAAVKTQMGMTLVFWFNFTQLTDNNSKDTPPDFDLAVKQLAMLLAPYLGPSVRNIAADYRSYIGA